MSDMEWRKHATNVMRFASAPCLAGMCFVLRDFDVEPLGLIRVEWPADNDNRGGFNGAPAA